MAARLRIGTAGWAIPRSVAEAFPVHGSGLQRYAARFDACEINSTFYRPHRPATWARWVEATPDDFRFAVKAPKAITHEARLSGCETQLAAFLTDIAHLGTKLGPMLVQLPPSLAFDADLAQAFFSGLRRLHGGPVVCEPRHAAWFEGEADRLLADYDVARVAADPARSPMAAKPGGAQNLIYFRLHGSPQMYRSPYDATALAALAEAFSANGAAETWCVFDNTTSGAAAANALDLATLLSRGP